MIEELVDIASRFAGDLPFIAIALILVWETVAPRRRHLIPLLTRWGTNAALGAINFFVTRLFAPLAAGGAAAWAQAHQMGLMNQVQLHPAAAVIGGVLCLDLWEYALHRLYHQSGALWRIHRTHHADVEVDVTTAYRFHPGQAALELTLRPLVAAALGLPVLSVFLFYVAVSLSGPFTHANARLPALIDRPLRWLLVTPDFHRVHHSVDAADQKVNLGVNFSIWDRLFGTYRDEVRGADKDGFALGVEDRRGPDDLKLLRTLADPFAP